MAAGLVLRFEGLGEADYKAVNDALGLDMYAKTGDFPAGLINHWGGTAEDGSFIVSEVWDSKGAQEKFMGERLGAALAKGGVTSAPEVTWTEVHAHQNF